MISDICFSTSSLVPTKLLVLNYFCSSHSNRSPINSKHLYFIILIHARTHFFFSQCTMLSGHLVKAWKFKCCFTFDRWTVTIQSYPFQCFNGMVPVFSNSNTLRCTSSVPNYSSFYLSKYIIFATYIDIIYIQMHSRIYIFFKIIYNLGRME